MKRPFSDAELVALLPKLRGYAFKLCGGTAYKAQADDLVQSTMVRALANARQFTAGTRLLAWLVTIMRNLHITLARAAAKRPMVDIDDIQVTVRGRQEDTVHLREVCRMADALPPQQAEAILLVGLDGAAYEEAAQELGIPTGTLKSRVSRARTALAGGEAT